MKESGSKIISICGFLHGLKNPQILPLTIKPNMSLPFIAKWRYAFGIFVVYSTQRIASVLRLGGFTKIKPLVVSIDAIPMVDNGRRFFSCHHLPDNSVRLHMKSTDLKGPSGLSYRSGMLGIPDFPRSFIKEVGFWAPPPAQNSSAFTVSEALAKKVQIWQCFNGHGLSPNGPRLGALVL